MTLGPGNLQPRGRRPAAERPPAVRELLAEHAARQRTSDDHMFTVTINGARAGTLRLQLFTAPGARPIAVATQYFPGEGAPLGTWDEVYASEAWRREFPGSAEPPVWISLRLHPEPASAPPEYFTLVTFQAGSGHELSSPQWYPVTDADVAALAGGPVSRDRGEGYLPWPRQPDPEPDWRVAWTILLPVPRGMSREDVRAAPPWWKRVARQVIPRRAPRDCCYYHRVDWHSVSAAAIRITRQARREGLAGRALADRAAELAEDQDLPQQEKEALADLFTGNKTIRPPRLLQRSRRHRYGNGRHRITVMLDTGVRRTVIERTRGKQRRKLRSSQLMTWTAIHGDARHDHRPDGPDPPDAGGARGARGR